MTWSALLTKLKVKKEKLRSSFKMPVSKSFLWKGQERASYNISANMVAKNIQQNASKYNSTNMKKDYIHWPSRIYHRNARFVQHTKSIIVIHQITKLKKYVIISIDTEKKHMKKKSTSCPNKNTEKLKTKSNFLNLIDKRALRKNSQLTLCFIEKDCTHFFYD